MSQRAIAIMVLIILVVVGVMMEMEKRPPPAAYVQPQETPNLPPAPEAAMGLKTVSWKRGGFNSVAIVTIKIINDNSRTIRDIDIKCQLYANSGTLIDIKTDTVYEAVMGKSSKTVKDFNLGFIDKQASSLSCSIISAKWG